VSNTAPTAAYLGRHRADTRLSPVFWRFWGATACFYMAEGIRLAALPLLAAAFTKNAFDVSLVSGAQSLASLLFGLQAGALADRFAPTRLMLSAGVARAVILGGVVITVAAGIHSVAILVAAAFLIGLSSTLNVAGLSLLPGLVSKQALERATSRIVVADVTFYEFFGPLVGGTLFALTRWLPIGADFAMQAAGVACVLSFLNTAISRSQGADRPRMNMRSDIASGIRFLAAERALLIITLTGALLNLANAAWMAVLVIYSERILRLTSSQYGLLLAAGALGGLCAAAVTGNLASRFPMRTTLIGSAVLSTVAPLLLATSHTPLLSAVLLALASGGIASWNVISISARQRQAPAEMLGRLNALLQFGLLAGAGIGALAGGWLTSALTITAPFVMAGTMGVLVIGVLLFGL
jgi:MFS family permease